MNRLMSPLIALVTIVLLASTATAQEPVSDHEIVDSLVEDARDLARDGTKEAHDLIDETIGEATGHGSGGGDGDEGEAGGDGGADAPGLSQGLVGSLGTMGILLAGLAGTAGLVGGGMFLMARYVDPKVALDNPQRAMLYGFIKGNPGVHLKQLSDDFDMKTSTVLWHIRKLEAAELVRSQKVNGFRVFYPVAGGMAAKELGMAVAALSNDNAARIIEYVSAVPGTGQRAIGDILDINPGTVRWHLRKLRDRGILREITEGRTSLYHPTDLGVQALRQARGLDEARVPPAHELIAEATA